MKILAITPQGKHDYLASNIIEGLKKLNIELYCTNEGNGAINIISEDEFIKHYNTCDFIFAIWGKSIYNNVPEPKFYLIDQVNGWDKTIYIDGSEYNYTGFPNKTTELLHPVFKEKAKLYFKRECLPEHIEQGIIPLPFAASENDFYENTLSKNIDVLCCFGQTNTGLRNIAIEACNELKSERYNIITTPITDYLNKLHQSWITIDAHGGGECNVRMWQIMSNHSCLFAQKYNIVIPNLIDEEHYVSWNSKEELKNKICEYLGNKKKLYYITDNSYSNIINNHTSKKRAEYMIKTLLTKSNL
jgi:hypothetical protein